MLLGDYAASTPTETLVARRDGTIPCDLARLSRLRFVYASEPEKHQELTEASVKKLLSGGEIQARYLHQNWFVYKPEFSLWLDTNNRPVIKGADDGIWDRIRLVPFTVRIPDVLPASRLKGNEEVLAEFRAEMSGILNWALAGLTAFLRHGLGSAQAVEAAGKAYRADSDLLGEFIGAHYVANTAGQTPVDAVYQAYQNWCGRSGLTAMSKVALCRELRERGWTDKRMKIAGHTALCWLGVTARGAAGGALAVCANTASAPA